MNSTIKIIDLPGEIWVPIPGYEDLYEVSNMARIKGLPGTLPIVVARRESDGGVVFQEEGRSEKRIFWEEKIQGCARTAVGAGEAIGQRLQIRLFQ